MDKCNKVLIFVGASAHPPFVIEMPHSVSRNQCYSCSFQTQHPSRFRPSSIGTNKNAAFPPSCFKNGQVRARAEPQVAILKVRLVVMTCDPALSIHQQSAIVKLAVIILRKAKSNGCSVLL